MMNRVSVLEQCKAALMAVRAQEGVVEGLQDAPLPQNAPVWQMRVDAAQRTLEASRRHYDTIYPVALGALDGLVGREYDVLWRYYVMGQTTREIARCRREAHRTITRAKAQGLRRLEGYHE